MKGKCHSKLTNTYTVAQTTLVVITWKRATSILQDISVVSLGRKNHTERVKDELFLAVRSIRETLVIACEARD